MVKVIRSVGFLLAACFLGSVGFNAQAQAPRDDTRGARMDISGYGIEGNRLLNPEDFTRIIAPFIGRQKTAADIERTRAAVQQAYHDLGHCDIRVTLARPEPEDGIVLFRLTEIPAAELRDCLPKLEVAAQLKPGVVAQAEPGKPAPPPAETAVIPAPRFDINRFEVVNNTLLPASELERLFAPYTGQNKDFGDIQRALESLEAAYRDRGYGVVQVLLPEQDITKGVVRFRVLQPRVGRVLIEGNTQFDNENVRYSLPTIKEGETPNSRDMARNLQILGEHPTKQTTVLLRSGASEDEVDVNVKIVDEKPWRVFLTLDNTGTDETGNYRLGIGYQNLNLFNRDHTLTAQFVTSPTEPAKVKIYGLGYRVPFYDLNSSLDLIAGYSDVNSGTVQGLFNVAGAGTVALARWNYYLPKWADVEQKLSFGLDYRAYQNDVLFQGQGQTLVPDITVHPASITYNGLWRMAAAELSFYGGFSANIPGGKNGDDAAFAASRVGATADYTILRAGFNYVQQFRNEWQTRVGFNGQYTSDLLVSGEQYGIGGPDSVRGYLVREVAGDRGGAVQFELYTPDFAGTIGLSDKYRIRGLAFYDFGQVNKNDAQPGEVDHAVLASTGLGVRLSYGKLVSLRFDVADILKPTPNIDKGSVRVSAALALIF